MSDRDALLHAIAEHPEEDVPRLMYADWLEENGDPERADFVRNQVEMARPGLDAGARYRLVRKNVYYLGNHVRRWKGELPRIDGIEWGDFNRGLVEEVRAGGGRPVVARAADIFAVPGIHVLRLWALTSAPELARVPELSRLRSLQLVTGATASALRELLASPHLGNLTVLDLHGSHTDDAMAADIADGRFPKLAELHLGSNRVLSDAGARVLANSPHLSNLRVLDLRGNRITDRAVRAALARRLGPALKL